jgi:uncharacterized protein YdhG (YjbR/CyaY superfamily)
LLQFRRATALADKLLIKTAKVTRPKTVADYLAAAPKDRRAALTRLRKTIKAAAPKATESISYGMAGYKHKGKSLVYFGYWRDHVALYATGSEFIKTHGAELKPYVQSKGTLQFPLDRPLPYGLVARIVRSRIAKIEESQR